MPPTDQALAWFGDWLRGGAVTAMRRGDGTLALDLSLVHGVDPSDPMQLRLFGVGACSVASDGVPSDWAAFERDLASDLGVFDLRSGSLVRAPSGHFELKLDGLVFPENLKRQARFALERVSFHREDGSELSLDVLAALHALWFTRRKRPASG